MGFSVYIFLCAFQWELCPLNISNLLQRLLATNDLF